MEASQALGSAETDPVRLALQRFGDAWSFRILRAAFYGTRRYDGFQAATGASPSLLAGRLKRLTEGGLFERVQYGAHAKRFEYVLTEQGRELYPIIVLMRQWGERYISEAAVSDALVHMPCGRPLIAVAVCKHCGEALRTDDTEVVGGG